MSASEDRDEFENSYYYFIQSVEVLAAQPGKACELLSQFNVSFETKFDIEAGSYLFNYECCPFSPEQRDAITSLIQDLNTLPAEILAFTKSPSHSLENMKHPCWVPLRQKAHYLLDLLHPITEQNRQYFYNSKT